MKIEQRCPRMACLKVRILLHLLDKGGASENPGLESAALEPDEEKWLLKNIYVEKAHLIFLLL